ncbi:hypothetical protein DERP_006310 [Dermatophagoides pteronyssinus]|uniref:Uncharacterized protein n=1 Tax=Dermatophagoides pteronyssinus TaxID=6956 RepID=A0ABQ8IY26_DERPT|nr:hypothetical protein DERP_006310 [Dermatophagoides pteronyssinus]
MKFIHVIRIYEEAKAKAKHYVCTGYNKAGTVSANVTLTVLRRLEVTAAAYSGQEVAGIVIGTLFIFLLVLIAIFSVVLRSRKFLHFRSPTNNNNNDHQSNHNGGGGSSVDNQTILGSTTITSNNSYHNGGTNGIIPNRHLQTTTTTTIPNGTLKRYSNNNNHNENSQNHILPSTTTASNKNLESNNNNESMKNNLIVSMNPANSDSSLKKSSFIHQYVVISDNNNQINNDDNNNKMNIISNQLAEQIEMCDYSLINSIETNDTTTKMIGQKCSAIDPSMEARVDNFNQKFINNNNQFVNQQQQQLPMSMSIDMKTLTQCSGIRNGLFNNHNTTNVKFPIQDSSFLRNGNKNPVIFSQQHYDDSIISNKNINQNLIFKTKSGTMNKIRSTNPYNNNTFDGHHNSSHIINNNSANNNPFNPYVNDANNHHTMNFFESSSITDMPSNGSQLLMGKTYLYGQQPYRSTDHHFSYDVKNNEQILMNRCIDSIHPYNESILPNMINQNNNCSLYDQQQQQQQRHLAASVAVVEELQTKFATRASPLNRIKNNGLNPSLMARDSPDEGLGEETE